MKTLRKVIVGTFLVLLGMTGIVKAEIDSLGVVKVVRNDSTFLRISVRILYFNADSVYFLIGTQQGASDILKIQGKVLKKSSSCEKGAINFGTLGIRCLVEQKLTLFDNVIGYSDFRTNVCVFEVPIKEILANAIVTTFLKRGYENTYACKKFNHL